MNIIEVLQPDGSTHVYTTEQRTTAAITQEVDTLYPDATLWRKSRDWRAAGSGRSVDAAGSARTVAKSALIVIVLAILLTPVITWISTLDGLNAEATGQPAHDTSRQGVAAHEAEAGSSEVVGDVATDVRIVSVASQESDSSLTLRLLVRNDGQQAYADIKIRAKFFDPFGAELPFDDGGQATISLDPGEEGYVKVWAHNEYGVAQYELAVLDE